MPTKKATEPFVFKYRGFELREDAVYIIKDKTVEETVEVFDPEQGRNVRIKSEFNSSVPTSKFPNISSGEVVQCPFRQGRWDTGLYETSPIWAHLPTNEVKIKVSQLQDFIVKPYEAAYGQGILDNNNDAFWNGDNTLDENQTNGIVSVDKYFNNTFNMKNPRKRLELWIAITSGILAPKGAEKNGQYKNATYVLVDDVLSQSKEKEFSSKKRKAMTNFMYLQEEAPSILDIISVYADVYKTTTASTLDEDSRFHYFNSFLDRTDANIERFNTAVELYNSSETKKQEMTVFYTLQKLASKNIIKKQGDDFAYEGILLGKTLKTAASKLVTDNTLSKVLVKLSEIEI